MYPTLVPANGGAIGPTLEAELIPFVESRALPGIRVALEPFVQIKGSPAQVTEGTGLGLAISRELARAMGGDVAVRSEQGKGATFTLTLPRS